MVRQVYEASDFRKKIRKLKNKLEGVVFSGKKRTKGEKRLTE
jgi:hypothetical protein